MVTLSFVADFTTRPLDLNLAEAGYTFTLDGDVCTPSRTELEYIFDHTPAVLLAMKDCQMPAEFKGGIRVKAADSAIVRSAHYTWHVKRKDGQPISRQELTYAFAMQGFGLQAEKCQPIVSLPLSTLSCLLGVDMDLSGAFVNVLANADRESGELIIDDQELASVLEEKGLVTNAGKPGRYLSLEIDIS